MYQQSKSQSLNFLLPNTFWGIFNMTILNEAAMVAPQQSTTEMYTTTPGMIAVETPTNSTAKDDNNSHSIDKPAADTELEFVTESISCDIFSSHGVASQRMDRDTTNKDFCSKAKEDTVRTEDSTTEVGKDGPPILLSEKSSTKPQQNSRDADHSPHFWLCCCLCPIQTQFGEEQTGSNNRSGHQNSCYCCDCPIISSDNNCDWCGGNKDGNGGCCEACNGEGCGNFYCCGEEADCCCSGCDCCCACLAAIPSF